MGELVRAGDVDIWAERAGRGPDVLLIAGLGTPAEAWQAQLDGLAGSYALTAFDNRGAGRTPLPADPRGTGALSIASMADDAAALLEALDIAAAHVAGFSMGSAIAQELAIRHPDLVRSLVLVSTWARADAYFRSLTKSWHWLADAAPSERSMLEAFFLWTYTRRAHSDGTVEQILDAGLAFAYPQSTEAFHCQLDAIEAHDSYDRLAEIGVPTLVLSGELDLTTPPDLARDVADQIPDAAFELVSGEAHMYFQEDPAAFNARVDRFWAEVDAPG